MASNDLTPRTILGVYLTPETLEAVVLRTSESGPRVLHRMVRPRLRIGDSATSDDYSSVLPGMKSSDEIDFTLEVGDRGADVDLDDPVIGGLQKEKGGAEAPRLFVSQLRELLTECKSRGYGMPELAFCVDTPDVEYVPITLAPDTAEEGSGRLQRLWNRSTAFGGGMNGRNRRLVDALRSEYTGTFDPARVEFVQMAPTGNGDVQYLALVPTPEESVTPTVRTLAAGNESVEETNRMLDAEASLLDYVVDRYVPVDEGESTAVVRVGADDTLVLFRTGHDLSQVERLRSVTSFDPAETICSRVLLYQDEAKIGEIDHLVLVGGPRDGRLVDRFASFYEEATVYELSNLLRDEEITAAPEVDSTLTPASGVAMAAAVRLLDDPSVNLFGPLPKARRRASALFNVSTVALLLLLIGASVFFGWRYVERQQEIAEIRQRIALSPVEMPELSPEALKQRVDSLNAEHVKYNRALHVLDSLLVGSDEWSRAIERTAEQTRNIKGIWFDNWSIDASTIQIKGHALQRSNLAELARNLEGTVRELKFTDIQGARAYPFTITIPRDIAIPDVTLKLREEALSPDLRAVSTP